MATREGDVRWRRCDVSVVIVSLNTRVLLEACLHSVFRSEGLTCEVFVVDNGSVDGSPEMLASSFPAATVLRNGENRGFAAASNRAIEQASGRYVLLLNPDTIVYPSTLRDMVGFLDRHPEAAICGPRILFPDGRFQSCGYRFPTLLREIRQSKNIDRVIRWLVGHEPSLEPQGAPCEVDWVDGACLLIRQGAIEQLGLLDEQYFLYAEELDWCRRARNAGWSIFALPDVEMLHYQGQSSVQMSDFSLGYLIETKLRYYRKHHGLPHAALTSLVYVAGCLRQIHRRPDTERIKLLATLRWWRSVLAS